MAWRRRRLAPLQCALLAACALIALWGWGLAVLGLWSRLASGSFGRVAGARAVVFVHVGDACVAAGCALGLAGAAGAWGAWARRPRLLLLFFMVVTVLFVAEVAAAVFVYDYTPFARSLVLDKALGALRGRYGAARDGGLVTEGWDAFMTKLRCCGVHGYGDFAGSAFQARSGRRYPRSCCLQPSNPTCDGHNTHPSVVHPQGCYKKLMALIKERSLGLGAAATVAALLQLFAMGVSLTLYMDLRSPPPPPHPAPEARRKAKAAPESKAAAGAAAI